MRSSLIISVIVHLVISVIAFEWVSFRSVKYVPRPMYNVTLVAAPVQAEPIKQPEPRKPEPEPVKAKPEPEPEPKPDEIPPPPENPKPRPEPKPAPEKPKPRREVPKTDVEETKPDASAEAGEAPTQTGEMSLDTDDFPFAPYINRVRRKIAANWRVPEGSQGQERFCRVYFRIRRDGSVSDVMVEETSELFMFDQAAERAVLNSAPLPPLPREYRDEYLGVHFSFVYRESR